MVIDCLVIGYILFVWSMFGLNFTYIITIFILYVSHSPPYFTVSKIEYACKVYKDNGR
jgi:hypothetical protein